MTSSWSFTRQLLQWCTVQQTWRVTKNVFCFSLKRLFETYLILRITERDMIKNVYWSSLQYSLFLSDGNGTWIFRTVFRKLLEYKISGISVRWDPSCSMWADRRTDKQKRTVFLRNFANAPTKRLSFGPSYLPGRPYLSTTRAFQRSVPHSFTFC